MCCPCVCVNAIVWFVCASVLFSGVLCVGCLVCVVCGVCACCVNLMCLGVVRVMYCVMVHKLCLCVVCLRGSFV